MRAREKIQYFLELAQVYFYRYLGWNLLCKCGHKAKRKTKLTFNGHSGIFTLPQKREYCPLCFTNAVISCAWCGKYIHPGDPITLNTPQNPDFTTPDHAVVHQREPRLRLVGCLRRGCSAQGMDRAGFWVMPGKVQRVQSIMEMALHSPQGAILINDLSDISEAIPIKD